jgi:hypothetical protein
MSAIRAVEARQLTDLFTGLTDVVRRGYHGSHRNAALVALNFSTLQVCAPGRHLLFQESMNGCKVKYLEGKPDPVIDKQRPYHIFVLNDAIVVGKEMSGLISTSYRARVYPIKKSDLWVPSTADVLSRVDRFVLRVKCCGKLTYDVENATYPASKTTGAAPVNPRKSIALDTPDEDDEGEFLLICGSVEQRDRLYNSFQFLKRKISPSSLPVTASTPSQAGTRRFSLDLSPPSDTAEEDGKPKVHSRIRSHAAARYSLTATKTTEDEEQADRPSARGSDALKALDSKLRESFVTPKIHDSFAAAGSGLQLNVAAIPSVPAMRTFDRRMLAFLGCITELALCSGDHRTYRRSSWAQASDLLRDVRHREILRG